MARHSVRVPAGSTILFEGREYSPASGQTTLPEHATEFGLIVKIPTTPEMRELGAGYTIQVYLPAVPIGTSLRDIRAMIAEIRDIPVGTSEWWEQFRDFITP